MSRSEIVEKEPHNLHHWKVDIYGIKIQNGGERLGNWSSQAAYSGIIIEEEEEEEEGERLGKWSNQAAYSDIMIEEEGERLGKWSCQAPYSDIIIEEEEEEEEEGERLGKWSSQAAYSDIIIEEEEGERLGKWSSQAAYSDVIIIEEEEEEPTLSSPLSSSLDRLSNSRSDDALDQLISAILKIKVVGEEKQVSAGLQQYNRIEEKEERTRGVVGKNWWDYNSCEEDDLEEGKLSIGVRWIKHYSSEYKILLVGEGDFSFSASLAMAFASAANITATSLDSNEFLITNYRHALSNIDKLRRLGAKVMHDVDATKMANVFPFKCMCFDRVVYNFPLAEFFPNESREDQIGRNQMLVQLFLENAKKMIHINGEIHITHKSNGFFHEWNLEFLASRVGLRLIEEVPFNFRDYPGYRTKYGFGGDDNFNCNPSRTYKFGLKKPNEKPNYRYILCNDPSGRSL